MKRSWRAVLVFSAATAGLRPAESGWFRNDRPCSPCPSACGPMLAYQVAPTSFNTWTVATPANGPGPAEAAPSASVAIGAGPVISLTSGRVGRAIAYEWNPSANGTLRAARSGQGGSIFDPAMAANAYQFLGSTSTAGGGYFGPGGSAAGGTSSAVSAFVAAPGESPFLASLLDRRAGTALASPGAEAGSSSGSNGPSDGSSGSVGSAGLLVADLAWPAAIPGPGDVSDFSSGSTFARPAIAAAAVPEPSAILSTIVGLGMAALAASRSRAPLAKPADPAPTA